MIKNNNNPDIVWEVGVFGSIFSVQLQFILNPDKKVHLQENFLLFPKNMLNYLDRKQIVKLKKWYTRVRKYARYGKNKHR